MIGLGPSVNYLIVTMLGSNGFNIGDLWRVSETGEPLVTTHKSSLPIVERKCLTKVNSRTDVPPPINCYVFFLQLANESFYQSFVSDVAGVLHLKSW